MIFTNQPHWLVGFSFQFQRQGCVAARLQTLASFPIQSLTPAFSEFAMIVLTPGWGQEKSCPLQTEPSARHIRLSQLRKENPTPATGVQVSPPQDDPSFLTGHDTATHIRNIHSALQGPDKRAMLLPQVRG